MKKLKLKPFRQSEKLNSYWAAKNNHLKHHTNLIFSVKQCKLVKKVHEIVYFIGTPWSKTFIEFDTEEKAAAEINSRKIDLKTLFFFLW